MTFTELRALHRISWLGAAHQPRASLFPAGGWRHSQGTGVDRLGGKSLIDRGRVGAIVGSQGGYISAFLVS